VTLAKQPNAGFWSIADVYEVCVLIAPNARNLALLAAPETRSL